MAYPGGRKINRHYVEQAGLFLALLLLWPTFAIAELQEVYSRRYERCFVSMALDPQAVLDGDDHTEFHFFGCSGERFGFSFIFSKGVLSVEFSGPSDAEYAEETISIAIRIDDTPTVRREVEQTHRGGGRISEPQLAYTLLDLLTTGQYAAIGVGKESGLIPLTPHVNTAAQDFRSRLPREE